MERLDRMTRLIASLACSARRDTCPTTLRERSCLIHLIHLSKVELRLRPGCYLVVPVPQTRRRVRLLLGKRLQIAETRQAA